MPDHHARPLYIEIYGFPYPVTVLQEKDNTFLLLPFPQLLHNVLCHTGIPVSFNHRHEDDVLEIGYTLHPDYWGRSYVPEAARALIDLGFKDLGLHKIELTCFGYNVQSQRVAEKLGFTLEACIRDRKDAQGNRCDSLMYGLLKSEWEVMIDG